MGRISGFFPAFVFVAVAIGACHGYFVQEGDITNYEDPRKIVAVPVPMAYGQGLNIPYEQQQQLLLQQQRQLSQQQMQQPMFLARIGRSHNFPSSVSRPRADEEEYEEEAAEDEQLSYAPTKRKKPKSKKKKDDEVSFPRRMYRKTKSAISSTTAAVFGAPKYIYTRYRDTYGFGKKKEKKEKKKPKGKGHEKGWGWDDGHHEEEKDNHGWGWESAGAGSSADAYERKTGGRTKYRYNKYSYSQPDEMRDMTPMSSLNAWAQ